MLQPVRSASLTTTHLWFTVRVITPLALNEYSGALLRASFFNAILDRFCANKTAPSCAECPLHQACPVSALIAPLREDHTGGQDIPRPYVIIPPLEGSKRYQPGEHFSFGMTLIGTIVQLLPYIMLSIPHIESGGLGQHLPENKGQRGHLQIELVECYHPFTDQRQVIYQSGNLRVQAPVITVQPQEYIARANQLSKEQITLHFITPLRLIYREHLVTHANFTPFIQRLLERYLSLEQHYGTPTPPPLREDKIATPATAITGKDNVTTQATAITGEGNIATATTAIAREGNIGAQEIAITEEDNSSIQGTSIASESEASDQRTAQAREEKIAWLQQADRIQCSSDHTHWQEIRGYSTRQKRQTPIGGLLGSATFTGNLAPFRELLVIGELIHVGKDIVKGNGWYKIVENP